MKTVNVEVTLHAFDMGEAARQAIKQASDFWLDQDHKDGLYLNGVSVVLKEFKAEEKYDEISYVFMFAATFITNEWE